MSDYGAMTTNERLFASGNLAAFDKAVAEKDEQTIRQILTKLEVDTPSIDGIVHQALAGELRS